MVLIEPGRGREARLLLAAHHLVVDGVSWRVLLEDLERVCGQLLRGESVTLPARRAPTVVGGAFARLRVGRGIRRGARPLGPYGRGGREALPRTSRGRRARRRTRWGRRPPSRWSWTRRRRGRCCGRSPRRTGRGWTRCSSRRCAWRCATGRGAERLFVDVESHGREELVEGLDLSRTVGWFTAIHPCGWSCRTAGVRARRSRR